MTETNCTMDSTQTPDPFQLVSPSEGFPIHSIETSNPIPFPELPGEGVVRLSKTSEGDTVTLTNFRVHVDAHPGRGLLNVPLGLIEAAEVRDLVFLYLSCKDGKSFQVKFENNEEVETFHGHLDLKLKPADKMEQVFAVAHFAWGREKKFEDMGSSNHRFLTQSVDEKGFKIDIQRLGFDLHHVWRISEVNKEYNFCSSYPEEILVPQSISDAELGKIGAFRAASRIPAIVWRHVRTGAVLARASQPEVGWFFWRCQPDEEFILAMAEACSMDNDVANVEAETSSGENTSIQDVEIAKEKDIRKVLIIDARSYAAAMGNRARGGGVECAEYYPNSEVQFMNLANIHSVRKSFQQLQALLNSPSDMSGWLTALDSTKWLSYISSLLKAAIRCASALDKEGRPVLVHCSDGWDRTPQIVSLAELILDPYYRTLEGFQVLVEREWLSFGHKMADRCGNAKATSDTNERSPVFLQWLDCVHQLLKQFPCHFEFNLTYLVKLGQHVYTNVFGNFLCNSKSERRSCHLQERTRSIWEYFQYHEVKVRNYIFNRNERETVIWPNAEVKDIAFWEDMYKSNIDLVSSTNVSTNGNGIQASGSSETSCDGSLSSGRENQVENGQEDIEDELPSKNFDNLTVGEPEKQATGQSTTAEEKQKNEELSGKCLEIVNTSTNNIVSSTDTLVPTQPEFSKRKRKLPLTINQSQPFEPPIYQVSVITSDPVDSDGILSHNDKIQQRMRDIVSQQYNEIQNIKRDLQISKLALANKSDEKSQAMDNNLLLASCDTEESSGVQTGSTAGGVSSWEAVDERDTKPNVLWLPNHGSTVCMKCQVSFWFGRRKHHCRSCGGLFCHDCSNKFVPLPREQLYHPVRVCIDCADAMNTTEETASNVNGNETTTEDSKICSNIEK